MNVARTPAPLRDSLLAAGVAGGTLLVVVTELLSAFQILNPASVRIAWIAILVAAALVLPRPRLAIRVDYFCAAIVASISGMAVLVAYTAWLSPPNSADTMAYHMPRVIYWSQQHSVAFFPTPYLNQIMMPPVAEYGMLHTYLLSGSDRFVNFVQWAGFVGSVVGVSLLARALGLSRRGQAWAALFCATLPGGILQASGAKNDYLLACWLISMAYFFLRWLQTEELPHLLLAALALGLALGTKGTAYLFAPPLLAGVMLAAGEWPVRWKQAMTVALLGVLTIDVAQYVRNFQLSGSILGFDSAHGDGRFRWRNGPPGVKALVSNLIRNTGEQLGGRSEAWNQGVFDAAVWLHRTLHLNPQDPATTWLWADYVPPKNSNHEADANNRWHLLILVAAAIFADRRWRFYGLGVMGGFLAFCFYLKWQPFQARMELPLFVAAAPFAAMFLERLKPTLAQTAAAFFLLSLARLPLTENWTRRLTGPGNLRSMPREQAYFNDMNQWNNRGAYLQAVDRTMQSGCRVVGIDIRENQLEYPLQALLLARDSTFRFVHTGVNNASLRFTRADTPKPCIVLEPGKP